MDTFQSAQSSFVKTIQFQNNSGRYYMQFELRSGKRYAYEIGAVLTSEFRDLLENDPDVSFGRLFNKVRAIYPETQLQSVTAVPV